MKVLAPYVEDDMRPVYHVAQGVSQAQLIKEAIKVALTVAPLICWRKVSPNADGQVSSHGTSRGCAFHDIFPKDLA